MLTKNLNSKGKEMLNTFFALDDSLYQSECKENTWAIEKFAGKPVVFVLSEMNILIKNIRMMEVESLGFLQFLAAKDMAAATKEK